MTERIGRAALVTGRGSVAGNVTRTGESVPTTDGGVSYTIARPL